MTRNPAQPPLGTTAVFMGLCGGSVLACERESTTVASNGNVEIICIGLVSDFVTCLESWRCLFQSHVLKT